MLGAEAGRAQCVTPRLLGAVDAAVDTVSPAASMLYLRRARLPCQVGGQGAGRGRGKWQPASPRGKGRGEPRPPTGFARNRRKRILTGSAARGERAPPASNALTPELVPPLPFPTLEDAGTAQNLRLAAWWTAPHERWRSYLTTAGRSNRGHAWLRVRVVFAFCSNSRKSR